MQICEAAARQPHELSVVDLMAARCLEVQILRIKPGKVCNPIPICEAYGFQSSSYDIGLIQFSHHSVRVNSGQSNCIAQLFLRHRQVKALPVGKADCREADRQFTEDMSHPSKSIASSDVRYPLSIDRGLDQRIQSITLDLKRAMTWRDPGVSCGRSLLFPAQSELARYDPRNTGGDAGDLANLQARARIRFDACRPP